MYFTCVHFGLLLPTAPYPNQDAAREALSIHYRKLLICRQCVSIAEILSIFQWRRLSRKFSVRLCSVLGYCLLQGWPKKRYKHRQGAECHPWFGHTWFGRPGFGCSWFLDVQGFRTSKVLDIQGFGHPGFWTSMVYGLPMVGTSIILDVEGLHWPRFKILSFDAWHLF